MTVRGPTLVFVLSCDVRSSRRPTVMCILLFLRPISKCPHFSRILSKYNSSKYTPAPSPISSSHDDCVSSLCVCFCFVSGLLITSDLLLSWPGQRLMGRLYPNRTSWWKCAFWATGHQDTLGRIKSCARCELCAKPPFTRLKRNITWLVAISDMRVDKHKKTPSDRYLLAFPLI